MLLQLYDSVYGEAAHEQLSHMSSSSLSFDLRERRFASARGVREAIRTEGINPKQTFLVCHGLSVRHLRFIRQGGDWAGIWWIGLGWDYYPLLVRRYFELLRPKTLRSLPRAALLTFTAGQGLTQGFRDVASLLFSLVLYSKPYRREIMRQLGGCYFSPGLGVEYNLLPPEIRDQLNYLPWTYGVSLDHASREDLWDKKRRVNSIVLGNSGTLEGNHLDAIQWLCNSKASVTLTIPIERGDPGVIALVERTASAKLPNGSVRFVKKKMSREQFLRLLTAHEFYVSGHRRQQGAGTLKMAITAGCTPVLDFDNPLAHDMLMRGFNMVSLTHFEESLKLPLGLRGLALSSEEKAWNVQQMKRHFSPDSLEPISSEESILHIQSQVRKASNE